MERERLIKSIKWSYFYLIIYCILTIYVALFCNDTILAICGSIGGVYVFVYAFFIQYKRERLFINGLLSMVTVLLLGVLLGKYLDLEGVIAIGAAISVVDVLSFTKYGKRTANAKAMSNITFASKLIVYGKEGKDTLIPTCGIGDYFYYAIWIAGLHSVTSSISTYYLGALMIVLGSSMHYVIISKIYKKENYKGFPATILPFACIGVVYAAAYFMGL